MCTLLPKHPIPPSLAPHPKSVSSLSVPLPWPTHVGHVTFPFSGEEPALSGRFFPFILEAGPSSLTTDFFLGRAPGLGPRVVLPLVVGDFLATFLVLAVPEGSADRFPCLLFVPPVFFLTDGEPTSAFFATPLLFEVLPMVLRVLELFELASFAVRFFVGFLVRLPLVCRLSEGRAPLRLLPAPEVRTDRLPLSDKRVTEATQSSSLRSITLDFGKSRAGQTPLFN